MPLLSRPELASPEVKKPERFSPEIPTPAISMLSPVLKYRRYEAGGSSALDLREAAGKC
jgi:hypothetical protein